MSTHSHFRRCHVCGELNCADDHLVTECQHCGKHLAPFYYFDESRAIGQLGSVQDQAEEYFKSSALPHRDYPPVRGLTVYWEW